MKSRLGLLCIALVALTALLIVPPLVAQAGQGMGQGMGQGVGMGQYDPSSVVTVKGTVQDVQTGMMQGAQGSHMKGMGGTHLVLKTDKGTLTVMVGPSSFLQQRNFALAKGDQIEVTGSKVKFAGSDAIIAREIKKGDQVLTLRDQKGVPEWSMGRQR